MTNTIPTGTATAQVEVLSAEVRTLMVGSRQVTLSVYRQLDTVPDDRCAPFGRVRDTAKDSQDVGVFVVGIDQHTGALVRSYRRTPSDTLILTPHNTDWYTTASEAPRQSVSIGQARNGRRWAADGGPQLGELLSLDGDTVYYQLQKPSRYGWGSHYLADVTDPVRWDFATNNDREAAERTAREWLTDRLPARQRYAEWMELPLIVLAGLK